MVIQMIKKDLIGNYLIYLQENSQSDRGFESLYVDLNYIFSFISFHALTILI